MSTNEMKKNPSTVADNTARSALIAHIMDCLVDEGLPVDRINDYATLCVEVDGRPLVVKVIAPKLYDKDGAELFSVDNGILEYEARVQADKEKAAKREEKERKAFDRKIAIEARKAAKNA